MSSLKVTKKASLLGSWSEDVFTDEIVKSIASRARTEKGKKVKVILNETGLKITRSRFFQEKVSKFFPVEDMKTVARSPEFSQCALFILSDPERKYKIIALRCATDADVAHLIDVFSEIQKEQQTTNVELRRRENGNWTLRGRTIHNANRHVAEIFRPNGQVSVKENGDITDSPVPKGKDDTSKSSHYKGVYVKRNNHSGSGKRIHKKKKDAGSDHDDDDDDYVIETEVLPYSYNTDTVSSAPDVSDGRVRTRQHRTSARSHQEGSRAPEPARSETHSRQTSFPTQSVVYATSSRKVVTSPQPIFHRVAPRAYESRMTASLVGYPTYSRAGMGQGPVEPQLVTVKVGGNRWSVMLDQRSLRSNSSKRSRSRSYDSYVPTSIVRPIEETYTRPVIIHHRGPNRVIEYISQPSPSRVVRSSEGRRHYDYVKYGDMPL